MARIETLEALEALYGTPGEASLVKVARRMTPGYRAFIAQSRFCTLTTVGPEGTDCSPRGDDGPVVTELDPGTLAMPDWRGNNRMDSLRNIVRDGRVSLSFFVAGATMVVRVNGSAHVSTDADLLARFSDRGRQPRSVIVIAIGEVYFQCARALMRAQLWQGIPAPEGLPSAGDLLSEMTEGRFDGASYDQEWPARAEKTLW
ncbi:pyridoxamine 5'-phosphate oxidase family protein [Pseudoruegeria sp. SHC-113]|uniref:pyridoxamine 5'-phosphate oxidase family protein n=1 Tax=Pseudoruegeria sp. SHC-113 TaxID=2855439 RepID=UPI0021BB0302|nr:pyridoxamine 5'-phosphate oxidase family protein [Pseudoruegeria sp. SHC-113]MCT8158962.1 pyridoxamine 5'-phosphate oxidase family protein [Pseudoruegeria sp. SHC-113]